MCGIPCTRANEGACELSAQVGSIITENIIYFFVRFKLNESSREPSTDSRVIAAATPIITFRIAVITSRYNRTRSPDYETYLDRLAGMRKERPIITVNNDKCSELFHKTLRDYLVNAPLTASSFRPLFSALTDELSEKGKETEREGRRRDRERGVEREGWRERSERRRRGMHNRRCRRRWG